MSLVQSHQPHKWQSAVKANSHFTNTIVEITAKKYKAITLRISPEKEIPYEEIKE